MDSQSAFQRLPAHVVFRIIKIAVGNAHSVIVFQYPEAPRSSLKSAFPFLGVNEVWRYSALRLLCRNVELFLGCTRSVKVAGFAALPTRFALPTRVTSSLVRTVTLNVARWPSIFDGTAPLILSSFISDGLAFPAARRVCIKLLQLPASKSSFYINWASGNELGFAKLVKQLSPAFSELSLDFGGNKPDSHLTLLYRTLLTELLLGTNKYALTDTYYIAYPHAFPLMLTNLVRLFFRCTALSLVQEVLIRLNALSLESLVVTMAFINTDSWMFNSSAVSLAVYPLLKYLHVSFPENVVNYAWPDTSDMVPFPRLVTLHMYGYYPFKDHVFFRGNRFSLRYATIPFNMLLRNIIGANDVFVSGHPNRLQSITISGPTYNDTIEAYTCGNSHINQQIGQIAASTSRLVHRPGNDTRKAVIRTFQIQHGLDGLEHLELSNRSLTLRDVVDLVSCLPGLSNLNCRLCKALSSIDSIDVVGRLGQLHSRIYPLSQRFKNWTMQRGSGISVRHIARSVMLITVLCPSFYFVRVDQDIRAAFNREVAWAILTAPFKKYATRLRNIVLGVGIADEVESNTGMESGPETSWNI